MAALMIVEQRNMCATHCNDAVMRTNQNEPNDSISVIAPLQSLVTKLGSLRMRLTTVSRASSNSLELAFHLVESLHRENRQGLLPTTNDRVFMYSEARSPRKIAANSHK